MRKSAPFFVVITVVVAVCLFVLNNLNNGENSESTTEATKTKVSSEQKTTRRSQPQTTAEKTTMPTTPEPPEKGAVYNEANGHWYKVFNYKDYGLAEDFDAWEQFCVSKNGYMAVINDAAENQFIYNYLLQKGLTVAFFGYTDEFAEGQWTWIHGNSTYTNWAPGQPNNGANNESGRTENYAQFYKETANGMWNDAPIAENSYRFVCEWGD